jgi:hypothetical protein
MAILQVWTGPRCQSGAVALGPLAQITSGRVTEAASGAQGPVLTIPRAVADQAQIRAGAWLWINHPRRGVSEWPILTVIKGDGRALDTVTVQGGTIRQAVALRGSIRTVNRYGPATRRFTLPALTVGEILRTYFFQNLDLDNLAWLTPGTYDYGGTITLGQIAKWSRAQLLDAIEKATGYRFVFVRLGDAAYRLDLRDPETLGNAPVLLAPGVTVDTLEQTEDLVSGATVVEPESATGDALGETWWTVVAITGTGPFWVRLADPTGGPAVIREDDQVNGWWLRPNDGLPVEITDARASDSSVQVATRTGLTVGELAALWSTADGALPSEVPSPAGITQRGRVVHSVSVGVPQMRGNRITDPALRNALASWQRVNASAGGADVFRRDDPVTQTIRVNGAVAASGTSVTVDGGTPNAMIRFGDVLLVDGVSATSNSNATTSATGTATVGLSAPLSATIAGDILLTWRRGAESMGTATTNGTQASGATSLALKTLTATPQLTAGDQIIRSGSAVYSFVGAAINYSDQTIGVSTTLTIIETRVIRERRVGSDVPTTRTETVRYTATVTADVAPGGIIGYTTVDRPPDPSGPDLIDWSAEPNIGSWSVPTTISTLTLSGAQPTWNGSAQATATISGTVGATIFGGERLTWVRSGVPQGDVQLTSGVGPSSTTLPLELTRGATRILSGDVFAVPSQTLYSATATPLSGTGTGTIALRAATVPGLVDNALITIQRCPDYAPAEFGGPVVLRLRGGATAAPATYLGGTDFGLYSPIFRVETPNPNELSYAVRLHFGFSTWSGEPSQSVSCYYALWDVDTGARLNSGFLVFGTAVYSPGFGIATSVVPTNLLISGQTTPRRLRLSLHPGSNQSGHLGGFVFLRALAATVYTSPELSPFQTAALVDGSFSNQGWHRAQDLLDATRDLARYRVQLGTVAPFADDPARLLTAGGAVRVRSAALGVDTPYRIARITWSLKDDDAIDLESATATPRLSEG